jgi:hypothetical protein
MFHANEIYYLSCQEASLPSLGSVENLAVECFLVISLQTGESTADLEGHGQARMELCLFC